MEHPGEVIKKMRLKKKWSQTLLADLAGLSSAHISLLESGQRTHLREGTVEGLASAFGLDVQTMRKKLGMDVEPKLKQYVALVESDGALSALQKERLIAMYRAYVGK